MGDPDAVGVALSKLYPKSKTVTTVLYVLFLIMMILLFWLIALVSVDDGELGICLFEVLLLLCFLEASRSAHKKGSVLLSVLSPLLFFCTYGWYALIVSDTQSGFSHLCSPMVLIFVCILTRDFEGLGIFGHVGGVTVAPWITYLTVTAYILILFLLISISISTWKLYRPTYSLFDKKAGKALTAIEKSACVILTLITFISYSPFGMSNAETDAPNSSMFNCVVVLQSDSPCAIEDISAEDIWIIKAHYDWSEYILSWDYENQDNDIVDTVYTYNSESITIPCGNKLSYVVKKEFLECKVSKSYVSVHFIERDYDQDDVVYQTLPEYLPETLEWQESISVGVISATLNSYNCVDVIINTET